MLDFDSAFFVQFPSRCLYQPRTKFQSNRIPEFSIDLFESKSRSLSIS